MMFTLVFRGSVGDIGAPNYMTWLDRKRQSGSQETATVAIYTVWLFWYINVVVTLIVMLNFLIAEVGQTYEKVMSLGNKNHYKQQAILNKKIYLILYWFRNLDIFTFDGVVFTTRDDTFQDDNEEFSQLRKIQNEIESVAGKVDDKMNDRI